VTPWVLSGWLAFAAASAVASVALARMREQSARVARASHELRGGLAMVWLALGRGDGVPPDTIAAQLARARRALDDLDEAAAAPDELVDLAALARTVAQGFPRVAVTAFGPAWVRGDAGALGQACSNLVANAVEHGALPVRVRAETAGGTARLEVSDGGPGFTPRPRPADPDLIGGWGFELMNELTSHWGVRRDECSRVWFELQRQPRATG